MAENENREEEIFEEGKTPENAEKQIIEAIEQAAEAAEADELDDRLANAKHVKIGKHAREDSNEGDDEEDVAEEPSDEGENGAVDTEGTDEIAPENPDQDPAAYYNNPTPFPEVPAMSVANGDTEPKSETISEPEFETEAEPEPVIEDKPTDKKNDLAGEEPNIKDLIIIGIIALILGIGLALLGTLVPKDPGDLPAATVNGTAIPEKEITQMVVDLRTEQGLTDDASWAQWLVDNGYTPETLRQSAIDNQVSILLIRQAAVEYDVEATQEEIDEAWNKAAVQLGGEDTLREMLTQAGNTESGYRENIELAIVEEKLARAVAGAVNEITDADVMEILKTYYPDEIAADATTLDGVDTELVDYIRQALAKDAISSKFGSWFTDYRSKADIVVSDMPEGLSYNVSLEGVEPSQTFDLSSLLGGNVQIIEGEDGTAQVVEGEGGTAQIVEGDESGE